MKIAWSRSAWASGPDAAAWAAAASVSALISACLSASVRWAIAISCSAAIRACSAAWRALASAIEAAWLDPRGLRPAEVGEVAAVVGDVLDLERVEDQALAGQRALGLVGHALREGRAVADDLLDGQATDDRAQRTGEHLLGEGLDVGLLAEEALRAEPDLVGVAAHLHDRDAVEVELDALPRDRAADLHRDPAAGEVHRGELLDQRDDEDAAAEDDLLAGEVGAELPGLRVEDRLALPAGDDERLVGTGHLVAAGDEQDQQQEEYDEADDRPQNGERHQMVPFSPQASRPGPR